MLSLDDERWSSLNGGYRVPFDPRPLLRNLEAGNDVQAVWDELWQGLHHQGDVGEASYAAVPHLVRIHRQRGVVDWNTYAIVATIELARGIGTNPDVPAWLRQGTRRRFTSSPRPVSESFRVPKPKRQSGPSSAFLPSGRGRGPMVKSFPVSRRTNCCNSRTRHSAPATTSPDNQRCGVWLCHLAEKGVKSVSQNSDMCRSADSQRRSLE